MSEPIQDKTQSDSDRLAELDRRLAAAEKIAQPDKLETGAVKMTPAAMKAARVGFELVLAMLFGLGIGWWLDKQFGTLPLLSLLFGLIGFGAGVMNAWRAVQGVYDEVGFRRDKTPQDR